MTSGKIEKKNPSKNKEDPKEESVNSIQWKIDIVYMPETHTQEKDWETGRKYNERIIFPERECKSEYKQKYKEKLRFIPNFIDDGEKIGGKKIKYPHGG